MKQPGESDSAASLRIAQSWLGGVVTAAKVAKPDVKVYMYDIWAAYDSGYQITSWPMAGTPNSSLFQRVIISFLYINI